MTSSSLPQCHNFLIVIDRSEFQKHSKKYLKNGASTKNYQDFIDHDDRLDTLDDINLENQDSRRNTRRANTSNIAVPLGRRRRGDKPQAVVRTKAAKQQDDEGPPSRGNTIKRGRPPTRGATVAPLRSATYRRHNGFLNTQVDTKLLVSVKEMAQRKRLKDVPENPEDLCQPLKIVLEDLSLEDGDRPMALDEDQL